MLWALHEHREILADLPVAVDFVAFMGEESGQWGSKDFVNRHGRDYSFALVGEPTAMRDGLVARGVPAEMIYRDYDGWRTWDSVASISRKRWTMASALRRSLTSS